MKYRAALLVCAALAGAAWILTARAGESRPELPPVLREGGVLRRCAPQALDAVLGRAPAAASPAAPSAPVAPAPTSEPALPAAAAPGTAAAPGRPILDPSSATGQVTPTTLGTLPVRF